MIGNDIIDLDKASKEQNYLRPKWLKKLFTSEEQDLIAEADDPFVLVWRLWSMKESAYKAFTQLHPQRFYKPTSFECEILNSSEGAIIFNAYTFHTSTTFHSTHLHTIAREKKEADINFSDFKVDCESYDQQSNMVHQKLKSEVSQFLNSPMESTNIRKDQFGIPAIYSGAELVPVSISMSHHGRHGGYAFSRLM